MLLLDLLAEKRISDAIAEGVFDGLPGAGKPVPEEDLSLVPESERAAYRILKNAGLIPQEIELHKEAVNVALRLATMPNGLPDVPGELLDRLSRINMLLAEKGLTQLQVPPDYAERIATRLDRKRERESGCPD